MKCSLRIERWSTDGERLNTSFIENLTIKDIKETFKDYLKQGVDAYLERRWEKGFTITLRVPWI